jgi:peptidoglycan hydrolase CwlO-like protein
VSRHNEVVTKMSLAVTSSARIDLTQMLRTKRYWWVFLCLFKLPGCTNAPPPDNSAYFQSQINSLQNQMNQVQNVVNQMSSLQNQMNELQNAINQISQKTNDICFREQMGATVIMPCNNGE